MTDEKMIKITKNGPYLVYGTIPLYDEDYAIDAMGKPIKWVRGKTYFTHSVYALCRCGMSGNKPFCDGSHTQGFDGTIVPESGTYESTCVRHEGADGIVLLEKPVLCTGAGFCHAGRKIEDCIKKEKYIERAKQQTFDCPGGSLTLIVDGKVLEPELEKEISVTTDARKEGPLWVKGGIQILSEDGSVRYETRNRVALCRCGKSKNKPFCDSSHLDH